MAATTVARAFNDFDRGLFPAFRPPALLEDPLALASLEDLDRDLPAPPPARFGVRPLRVARRTSSVVISTRTAGFVLILLMVLGAGAAIVVFN